MAHFINPESGSPSDAISLRTGQSANIQLWGGGPGGEDLVVVATDPEIVRIDELFNQPQPANTRIFRLVAVSAGSIQVVARLGTTGPVWAFIRVIVGAHSRDLRYFYHGTSLENARTLVNDTIGVMSAMEISATDWRDYTDFGKGFYTHTAENKRLAYDWAARHNPEVGVVEFVLLSSELEQVAGHVLYFPRRSSRPGNAPLLPIEDPGEQICVERHASWLEFVEFNRGIVRSNSEIVEPNRPLDKDWSQRYSAMKGPIWGRRDSHLPGGPSLPEHIHQVNWGRAGLNLMNSDAAKARRKVLTAKDFL